MGSYLVMVLILLVLGFWLGWAVGRIRRRKRSGKGCGSCSSDCPDHDRCR